MSDFFIQCYFRVPFISYFVTSFVTEKSVIQNVRLFLDNATVEGVFLLLLRQLLPCVIGVQRPLTKTNSIQFNSNHFCNQLLVS